MGTRANVSVLVLVAFAAVAAVLPGTDAAEYTVGDNTGWDTPSSSSFYSDWASSHTFRVNDTLVFNFATGAHTVATVTEQAFNACTTANPISLETTGPATITLNSTGDHHFICTITGHCSRGQKLAVNVVSDSTPGSAPSPPGTSSPSAPPPPSSASSLAATFFVSFMSMTIAFLC